MNQSQRIDFFYNIFDQATMYLVENLGWDYLSCLLRVAQDISIGINDAGLDSIEMLESLYIKLEKEQYASEDVRIAFYLLLIKAFKQQTKCRIAAITPDAVGLIFSFVIQKWNVAPLTLVDVGLGTGNLLYTCYNAMHNDTRLIGIEKEDIMVKIAKASSELQQIPVTIFHNDWYDDFDIQGNIIIGDIEELDVREVHVLIKHYAKKLSFDGLFLFLLDNSLFKENTMDILDSDVQGTIIARITLPPTMFQEQHQGKSIIIGVAKRMACERLELILPSLHEKEKLNNTIQILGEWIEKVKGMVI